MEAPGARRFAFLLTPTSAADKGHDRVVAAGGSVLTMSVDMPPARPPWLPEDVYLNVAHTERVQIMTLTGGSIPHMLRAASDWLDTHPYVLVINLNLGWAPKADGTFFHELVLAVDVGDAHPDPQEWAPLHLGAPE